MTEYKFRGLVTNLCAWCITSNQANVHSLLSIEKCWSQEHEANFTSGGFDFLVLCHLYIRAILYSFFCSVTEGVAIFATLTTGSPSLQFVALRNLYMYKDFVWELLDWVIYKTLYGNPLDFSKIYDIVMNDEIKLTYLLFSMYLTVKFGGHLEPFWAIYYRLGSPWL